MNHGGDDAVFSVVVGIAATVVEAALDVGGHQIGEHLHHLLAYRTPTDRLYFAYTSFLKFRV